jgi:5-methylcytosine-specific restriction enzyme subunit McrC
VKTTVTVREYARLTTEPVAKPTLDHAQVSATAFDWLCHLNAGFSRSGTLKLVTMENRRWLKLDNYVGVVETPCGTRLEILPKHVEQGECATSSRNLLKRMMATALDLPVREAGVASLQVFEDTPLSEWVMGQFLLALDHLVKRGVRAAYWRIEAEERYLRGGLDVVRQMRQPPGRGHVFQIRHDLFLYDRPENRLLKRALEYVCHLTQTPAHWRLAQELRGLLQEIPASSDVNQDFKLWRTDRLMNHYQSVRPWCELILYRLMPLALAGNWRGISLLFPMEKLFERYVAINLRRVLLADARLTIQAASQYLCQHEGKKLFRLEPDLLIEHQQRRWVLDTKWKRLNAANREDKYGLSQGDFYQLFAYGQKYLAGQGTLVLIYPRHPGFQEALPRFYFNDNLNLWVLPFNLDTACLQQAESAGLPLREVGM